MAKFAAVILALAGVAALAASAAIALGSFQATNGVTARRFDCGSVLFTKDPRTLAPKFAQVPRYLNLANKNCDKTRSDRTNKALIFMFAGAAPLLLVLALPAISRSSRRAKGRRRRK